MPNVDFIIDIGGQDIKCFKIHNGVIDNIFLNEACSSGCGSFLQTFASALGYDDRGFRQAGSVCAQAGRSRFPLHGVYEFLRQAGAEGRRGRRPIFPPACPSRVVKNALYKVIRCSGPQELGRHIVVQGGTFLNDAVLRAFENELGVDVVTPGYRGPDGRLRRGAATPKNSARCIRAKAPCSALRTLERLHPQRQAGALRPVRKPLPPDGQRLRRRPPVHQRQSLRPSGFRQQAAERPESLRLQAGKRCWPS